MAYFQLEDLDGSTEIVVLPRDFERISGQLIKDSLVYVRGTLDRRSDEPKVVARELMPLEEVPRRLTKTVHVSVQALGLQEETLGQLKDVLSRHPGDRTVYLHIEEPGKPEVVILCEQCVGTGAPEVLERDVEELLGKGSVRLAP